MAHSSWGPGWPNCQASRIVTVTEHGMRLPVRKEIAPLVAGLVDDLATARGRPFRADWSWGFACRAISGTTSPSNHSWGLAVDLDAPENPYLDAATHKQPHSLRKTYPGGRVLRSTMPLNAETIARKWGFRWGGTYVTKPDPMHFEFMGSRADARRLRRKHRPMALFEITITKRFKRRGWQRALALARRKRAAGFRAKVEKVKTRRK